jgi:cytochrome b involved in lipid metabolism
VARATGSLPVIARAELAKHKTRDSCWVRLLCVCVYFSCFDTCLLQVMVGDYVYDVTEFLRFHPVNMIECVALCS